MTAVAFLDTESTGLNPEVHELWEVALILRDGDHERRMVWQLPVDLGRADPMALTVGHFYERRWVDVREAESKEEALYGYSDRVVAPDTLSKWAYDFAALTHGVRLVVNNPSFDIDFLSRLLRRNGACAGWHYQVMNARDLALGYLLGQPASGFAQDELIDLRTDTLFGLLGVMIDPGKRHTALGDAELIRDVYDKVMGTDA